MEKSIRDLIARLPIPGLKESTDRHIIAEVLSKSLSIQIKASQINVKEGVVMVSVPPIIKSVFILKQHELLEALKKEDIQVNAVK